MALALYRKYRPQTFGEITGQQHVKITLEREVATNKVAHAYLFSGPRGTGKTSIARILAKAINCEKRENDTGEPCNKCEACLTITAGRSLDIIEIDAASYTGVDMVRETIVETARFSPSKLRIKVFIIDEAHMLSTSAWNALLKIMEEPPAHVIFILATTEVHKVPATILSRCQRFDFHRLAQADLVKRLSFIAVKEKVKITEPVLEQVAYLSEGCARDAEGLLEQLSSLGEGEINEDMASLVLPRTSMPLAVDLLESLAAQDVRRGLEIIGLLLEQGISLPQFTQNVLELLRMSLITKVTRDEKIISFDQATAERLKKIVNCLELNQLLYYIDAFVKAKQELKTTAIPQLPLEIAVVEVGGARSDGDLVRKTEDRRQKTELSQKKIRPPSSVLRPPSAQDYSVSPQNKQKVKVSFSTIKEKWPEVIKLVQNENHSLPFLLSTSEPLRVEDDVLWIGVQYPFHCDKLNGIKCRTILEKVISEACEASVRIKAIVSNSITATSDSVDEVLKTLGGRVVE